MNTPNENLLAVLQQIMLLEREYETSLIQGKEFDYLKEIRVRLNHLEEKFSELKKQG